MIEQFGNSTTHTRSGVNQIIGRRSRSNRKRGPALEALEERTLLSVLSNSLSPGQNVYQDQSVEGYYDTNQNDIIDGGDVLFGEIRIDTKLTPVSAPMNNQLYIAFSIQFDPAAPPVDTIGAPGNTVDNAQYNLTWRPTPAAHPRSLNSMFAGFGLPAIPAGTIGAVISRPGGFARDHILQDPPDIGNGPPGTDVTDFVADLASPVQNPGRELEFYGGFALPIDFFAGQSAMFIPGDVNPYVGNAAAYIAASTSGITVANFASGMTILLNNQPSITYNRLVVANNPVTGAASIYDWVLNNGTISGADPRSSGFRPDFVDNAKFVVNATLTPTIDIEKTTTGSPNGNATAPDFDNEDSPNGGGIPVLTLGSMVTWTYKVTNTGTVSIQGAQVTVTDSVPGVTPVRVTPDFVGDNDNLLEPGEMWKYAATGTVLDLGASPLPAGTTIVQGCGSSSTGGLVRNTYENSGTVTVPGATDSDLSHYCNPKPSVDIEKTTSGSPNGNPTTPDFDNEDSANGNGVPVLTPGAAVTWTYKVTNTGTVTVPLAQVTVTDSVPGVTPVRVTPDFVGDDDNLLEPGEMWKYVATGTVLDLDTLPLGGAIVIGCNNVPAGGPPRNTYENNGTAAVPGAMDTDPSHYCNPLGKISGSKTLVSQAPGLSGRMTGGGSIFTRAGDIPGTVGTRITHGFEIRCQASDPRQNLEINWSSGVAGQNNFHLESVTTALCVDDPNIAPQPPAAPFDTYFGVGTGKLNGVLGATIEWKFTDAGEPGLFDTVKYLIRDPSNNIVLMTGEYPLQDPADPGHSTGNQQAHSDGNFTGSGGTVAPGVGYNIHLIGTSGAALGFHDHTQTDSNGNYSFMNLRPGGYTICEELPPGVTQVSPSFGPDCSTHAPIIQFPMAANGIAVTLPTGVSVEHQDFVNMTEAPQLDGRMTGGGSIFTSNGNTPFAAVSANSASPGLRITHGFEIHCNPSTNPQRIEVNWEDAAGNHNHFHLLSMTSATCKDTAIIQNPPNAPIDTYIGVGTGRFSGKVNGVTYKNAQPFTISFTFTDGGPTKGEPGIFDTASYKITGLDPNNNPVTVLSVGLTPLTFGNQQAHKENKSPLSPGSASIQNKIDVTLNKLDSTNNSNATVLDLTNQLLALFDQFEASLSDGGGGNGGGNGGGGKKLVAGDDTAATISDSFADGLLSGELHVSIQDAASMDAALLTRIRDAIATLNSRLAPLGVSLTEVSADTGVTADLTIRVATDSACGTAADGVLGCETTDGAITIVQGWSWYTGGNANQVGSNQYDFQTIVTHELGHGTGLDHSSDTHSAMYPALSRGVARRDLTAQDLATIGQAREEAGAHALLAAEPLVEIGGPGVAPQPQAPHRFKDTDHIQVMDSLVLPLSYTDNVLRTMRSMGWRDDVLWGGDGTDMQLGGLISGIGKPPGADENLHDLILDSDTRLDARSKLICSLADEASDSSGAAILATDAEALTCDTDRSDVTGLLVLDHEIAELLGDSEYNG